MADRKKREGDCSTGQSPKWAVVPMEKEEEYYLLVARSLLGCNLS